MKLILLLIFVSIAAACGSGVNKTSSGIDPNSIDELRAYVRTLPAPNESTIEITFHRGLAHGGSGATNTGSEGNVIPVDNALFNNAAMTAATNEAGKAIYTLDVSQAKSVNLISATVGGKTFEGRTPRKIGETNVMMIVTMAPVTK